MKKLALLAVLLLPAASHAQQPLSFPQYGFRIAPLQAANPNPPASPVILFMPPSGGFASNVNVQIQPFDKGIEAYATASKGQFTTAGVAINSEKIEGDTWTIEYSGQMQGRKLHFYARALFKKDRVFLVTATAPEGDWTTDSSALKACVDSFQLD